LLASYIGNTRYWRSKWQSQGKAGQSRAKQAKQGKAGQSRAKQGKAGQSRAKQWQSMAMQWQSIGKVKGKADRAESKAKQMAKHEAAMLAICYRSITGGYLAGANLAGDFCGGKSMQ
jgi:ATPase subunit of ABC transporter with duplicated ATPase domains